MWEDGVRVAVLKLCLEAPGGAAPGVLDQHSLFFLSIMSISEYPVDFATGMAISGFGCFWQWQIPTMKSYL